MNTLQGSLAVRVNLVATLLAATVVLSGCQNASSSTGGHDGGPVPTSQMNIHATVETHDTTTAVVSVYLNDGRLFGSQYRLDGGDYLRACGAGACKNLREDFNALDVLFPFLPSGYSNGFAVSAAQDYIISFNRISGGNAPNTYVRLPPPFDILAPANNTQVTDRQLIALEWAPSGAGYVVFVDTDVDCTHTDGVHTVASGPTLSDNDRNGITVLSVDDTVASARNALPSLAPIHHCDIDATVHHEQAGYVDNAFARGDIKAVTWRRVRLRYVPST